MIAAPPPVAAVAAADGARTSRLQELHDRHRELDAFDLLDAPTGDDQAAIDAAFLRFCELAAPWTLGAAAADLSERARELFLAGVRAYAELNDAERRTSLIARRQSPLEKSRQTDARDAFRIETELLDPAAQYRQGLELMENGKYTAALEQLKFASDCEPQNSTYRAEHARCWYLSSPSTRAKEACQELEEAIRVDPQCGVAYFYCGDILAKMDRVGPAQVKLKRAAKLMLPDRRPLELLNSLQASKQNKKGFAKWARR